MTQQFQDETAQLKTTYESNRAEYERANGIVSVRSLLCGIVPPLRD